MTLAPDPSFLLMLVLLCIGGGMWVSLREKKG